MSKYLIITIKYGKPTEDGGFKKVTEQFIADAKSFSEAEAIAYKWCEENVTGESTIHNIQNTNISEIVQPLDQTGNESWWKCKIQYETCDSESEKVTKITNYALFMGEDVESVNDLIKAHLHGMLVPYTVPSVVQTKILEYIPYVKASSPVFDGECDDEFDDECDESCED